MSTPSNAPGSTAVAPAQSDVDPAASPASAVAASADPGAGRSPLLRALSFRNMSAVYIFVLLFLVFALWTPDSFLAAGTWRSLLDAEAITALAGLAALIPLLTGAFNLAVGAEVGLGGILAAVLLSQAGLSVPVTVVVTLLVGAAVGLVSGLIITKVKIDSFIATLGMSSILSAAIAWLSNSQQVLGLGTEFSKLALTQIFGITLPVYLLLIVAIVAWYLTERTPMGRRMYAVGYNPDGARLAGINNARLQIGSLMAGGVLASLAGILLTARINVGDPSLGPSLLLPALTAVFLGSTQFRGGRFNIWGTVVAVYVLAVGIKGLQLVGAPNWINLLFNGLALLIAVGLARWERTSKVTGAIRRATTFRRKPQPTQT
ncbi:ABC transporter permease [Geodermatophilus sp. URMC 62]|uniref:ABC transporter permease n=1 Tax=Geodermatophilus sp. URMC 62 TaxID=3423414 RepID=UPI00406CF7C2